MQTRDITHAHLPYNNILIKIVVQHGCEYFVDNIVRENIIKDLLINFLRERLRNIDVQLSCNCKHYRTKASLLCGALHHMFVQISTL